MTKRRSQRRLEVKPEYLFDRQHALKLERVYEIISPTQQRLLGASATAHAHEDSGNSCTDGPVQTWRGAQDRERGLRAARVRGKRKV